MWFRRNWYYSIGGIEDFDRSFLAIFCCSINNLRSGKLSRLEKFFELNGLVTAYQEVIASAEKPLFTLNVFTKEPLDLVTISLIEQCFSVKTTIKKIPKRNWLRASNIKFSPVKINKFTVTSSFFANSIKQDKFSLIIDASLAFGTGHHYTTKFCLQLIQDLKKREVNPLKIIDVGCGTGILSIAIAKLFPSRIIAVDNDFHSVEMTKRNIVVNKVANYVKVYKSTGLVGNHLNSRAKYDLIVANILYKPLKTLMWSFTINLSNNGFLILSGLNIQQARHLKSISRQFGFRVIDEKKEANWAALLLRKIDCKRATPLND